MGPSLIWLQVRTAVAPSGAAPPRRACPPRLSSDARPLPCCPHRGHAGGREPARAVGLLVRLGRRRGADGHGGRRPTQYRERTTTTERAVTSPAGPAPPRARGRRGRSPQVAQHQFGVEGLRQQVGSGYGVRLTLQTTSSTSSPSERVNAYTSSCSGSSIVKSPSATTGSLVPQRDQPPVVGEHRRRVVARGVGVPLGVVGVDRHPRRPGGEPGVVGGRPTAPASGRCRGSSGAAPPARRPGPRPATTAARSG